MAYIDAATENLISTLEAENTKLRKMAEELIQGVLTMHDALRRQAKGEPRVVVAMPSEAKANKLKKLLEA